MPRLRNTLTGAVVSCSDETAARLGGEWVPADVKPGQSASKPRRKRTSTKSDDD